MAQVTEDEVRTLTSVQTDEIDSDEMATLIDLAEGRVEDDVEEAIPQASDEKIRRLELFYTSHLVKLEQRGASVIRSDGQTEIEEMNPEEGTVYSVMYEDEKSDIGGVKFGHAG